MNDNDYHSKFVSFAESRNNFDKEFPSLAGIKHWSMKAGQEITYRKEDSHTLSIYVDGGQNNVRIDQPGKKGITGNLSFMHQGNETNWLINDTVEFIHLYFNDSLLKHFASTTFEMDVRLLEIQDMLFQNDLILKKLMLDNFVVCKNISHCSPMFAEQAINEVMHYLITNYNGYSITPPILKGGLSPFHLKQTIENIKDNLDNSLTIDHLANQVNLSSFHFAHMFKLSLGDSPAKYIMRLRLNKVKELLSTNCNLNDISIKTGFNHQSHMTHQFKRYTGYTPGQYRSLIE